MSWFRNMRTLGKIMSCVALMLILLVVVSCLAYRSGTNMEDSMKTLYDDFASPAIYMSQAQSDAHEARYIILSAVVVTDETLLRTYQAEITKKRNDVAEALTKYKMTKMSDAERAILARLEVARGKIGPIQDQALRLGVENRNQEALELLSTPDMVALEKEYFGCYGELTDLLMKLADQTKNSSISAATDSIRLTLIISVIAVVAGALVGFLIARMITGPLNALREGVKMFSHGDLTVSLKSDGKDEIAQVGSELQDMSSALNRVIGAASEGSRNISETAQDFSAAAQETNASVEEFRANVEDMGANLDKLAASGEEVNASVEEVAAGAQATAEKGTNIARRVDEAITAGDSGVDAVRRVVGSISEVAESSTATTTAVLELGNRARQIQGFVSQIGGIADQTNLLALNAAIEAARAGDAGRGFAVVAEEVRKLAEESNVAAKNIAELASKITGELDSIVNFSQANAEKSTRAKDLSADTESAINKMIEYLREIAGSTQDLAAVAQEQAASSEEIAETIQNMSLRVSDAARAGDNIRTSVADVASAAERIALGAEGLTTLSAELAEELSFFTIAEAHEYKKPSADRLRALPG